MLIYGLFLGFLAVLGRFERVLVLSSFVIHIILSSKERQWLEEDCNVPLVKPGGD